MMYDRELINKIKKNDTRVESIFPEVNKKGCGKKNPNDEKVNFNITTASTAKNLPWRTCIEPGY